MKKIIFEKVIHRNEKCEAGRDKETGRSADKTSVTLAPLSEKGKEDILAFRRWLETHRYPVTTVKTYTGMVKAFMRFVRPKEAVECNAMDLERLVGDYILPKGLSSSFQNQMISAVKKFYSTIYKSVIDPVAFSRPKREKRLPHVLSKEEVKQIITAPANLKHRTMLSLIYALWTEEE